MHATLLQAQGGAPSAAKEVKPKSGECAGWSGRLIREPTAGQCIHYAVRKRAACTAAGAHPGAGIAAWAHHPNCAAPPRCCAEPAAKPKKAAAAEEEDSDVSGIRELSLQRVVQPASNTYSRCGVHCLRWLFDCMAADAGACHTLLRFLQAEGEQDAEAAEALLAAAGEEGEVAPKVAKAAKKKRSRPDNAAAAGTTEGGSSGGKPKGGGRKAARKVGV